MDFNGKRPQTASQGYMGLKNQLLSRPKSTVLKQSKSSLTVNLKKAPLGLESLF